MERCHTSTCGQRGCPLQGGCCNLLHRLNSSTNSAEPPAHVSAAHCTSDEARLEEEEDTLNCSPHSSFNMFSTVSDELMKDTYKYKDIWMFPNLLRHTFTQNWNILQPAPALTFVSAANEVFDQAAYFSHLLLPRGQRGCCDVGFAWLHAFRLLLDIALQKPDAIKCQAE